MGKGDGGGMDRVMGDVRVQQGEGREKDGIDVRTAQRWTH